MQARATGNEPKRSSISNGASICCSGVNPGNRAQKLSALGLMKQDQQLKGHRAHSTVGSVPFRSFRSAKFRFDTQILDGSSEQVMKDLVMRYVLKDWQRMRRKVEEGRRDEILTKTW